jgi:hypothetical protein
VFWDCIFRLKWLHEYGFKPAGRTPCNGQENALAMGGLAIKPEAVACDAGAL